ncbi:MAG TPA: NUDIX domain-containing protein [Tepidisphaeraceae bacterium]|jgi:8-oxo-dGTP pyrophosphatase MutT (NUDIX family)|nr:NUDIX domain-containing protein [Tepidisphaeraceae bacterium]
MQDENQVSIRLIEIVRQHDAQDEHEVRHRDHVLRFLSESKRPMDRYIYEPGHITGSAFVGSEDGKHVLLIHHAKLNRWLQPGGHAEAGETDARHVARREMEEEVGLVSGERDGELFDIDVHTIPARGEQPEHFHFDMRYLFLMPRGNVTAAAEVKDARWFELEEAERITNEHGLRRMIGKLRKRMEK